MLGGIIDSAGILRASGSEASEGAAAAQLEVRKNARKQRGPSFRACAHCSRCWRRVQDMNAGGTLHVTVLGMTGPSRLENNLFPAGKEITV